MITPLYNQEYTEFVLPLICKAQNTIDIVTYDWRWYPDNPEHEIQKLNTAIIFSLSRLVKVRAILQDKNMVQFLRDLKISARHFHHQPTLHAKFLLIDDRYLILGSHNLTHRAMDYNIETSLLIDDPDIVLYYKLLFNNLYGL